MKKFVYNSYWFYLVVFVGLILWIAFNLRLDIDSREPKIGFTTITDYVVETVTDKEAPKGIRQRYKFTLNQSEASFCHLIFYSVHQEVIVSLDKEIIYSLKTDKFNSFGHTPGSIWNIIQLNESDNNKEIQIDFIPVYDSVIDHLPIIYHGDRYDVFTSMFMRSLPEILLSMIAIIAGVIYIIFIMYTYKKGATDNDLVMLGLFSLLVGLWKLSETDIFSYLVQNNLLSTYLPYFALLLTCIPYNIFIRSLHSNKEHWAWSITCIVSYIAMSIEIILQLLHIADFRETLALTHFSFLVMAIVIVAMMICDIHKLGLNKRLKKHALCISGCIVGLAIDILIFYATSSQGKLICGMFGFIIYIFVLGISSMQDIRQLISIGQEAQKFEQMAYHDKLTGLFNRTAYADYTENKDFSPEHMIVAMFDLNNLKKCNDEFGHEQGDVYITTCAKLISDCFSNKGNCYRMGGDEFCVLMKGDTIESCKDSVDALNQKITQENEKNLLSIKMAIACGYVMYDRILDYDIQDTMRRADKVMYKQKFSMKQQEMTGQS